MTPSPLVAVDFNVCNKIAVVEFPKLCSHWGYSQIRAIKGLTGLNGKPRPMPGPFLDLYIQYSWLVQTKMPTVTYCGQWVRVVLGLDMRFLGVI